MAADHNKDSLFQVQLSIYGQALAMLSFWKLIIYLTAERRFLVKLSKRPIISFPILMHYNLLFMIL